MKATGVTTRLLAIGVAFGLLTVPASAQIEIDFFERAVVDSATGAPLFLKDLPALIAHDPNNGLFDGGTAVSLNGNFQQINAEIGLSTNSNAITQGNQALNISMINGPGNQGTGDTAFDRPAVLRIQSSDPRYPGIQSVAANPGNFKMVADITLVADEFPEDYGTFVRVGFFQNSAGFVEPPSLRDNLLWGGADLQELQNIGYSRKTIEFPATDLLLPTDPGAYQIGFVFNGNWAQNERAAFNIDNWRFEELFNIASLDINGDGKVDAADWGILISNYLNPNATTFAQGDLTGDGQVGFQDLRFFEDGWNQIGAPTTFAQMIAGVPEPSSAVLMLVAATSFLALRRRKTIALSLALICFLGFSVQPVEAQLANTLMFDWEDGLQGWGVAGDATLNPVLGNSPLGATHGSSSSLSVTQELDGFSWNASVGIFGNDNVNLQALESALNVGAEHFVLEMDVTYISPSSIPSGFGTFANVSFRIGTSGASSEVHGLGNYDFSSSPQTISISEPLTSWAALPSQSGQSGFYNLTIGMNGDWGFSAGTFYFDNLRLRQVSAPPVLTLEVNHIDGSARIVNNSGLDGTGPGGAGGPVEFNVYQITSAPGSAADVDNDGIVDGLDFLAIQRDNPALIPEWEATFGTSGGGGSLNPAEWNSLDAQNIGATGSGGLLDGWDASAGNPEAIAEVFFQGSSVLADNQSFGLGNIFTVGGAENLVFQYREPSRPDFLRTGNVVYVDAVAGSFVAFVPEPASIILLLIGGSTLLWSRR